MTLVTVNDDAVSADLPRRRWFLRRRVILGCFAGAIVLVLLFQFVLMPWVVRDRVRAAFRQAGLSEATWRVSRATPWATEIRDVAFGPVNRVDKVRVTYTVQTLFEREVKGITLSGATLSIDPADWPFDRKPSSATRKSPPATSRTPSPAIDLPFSQLRLESSQLVLDDSTSLPVEGTLTRTGRDVEVRVTSLGEQSIDARAKLARSLDAGSAEVKLAGVTGDTIAAILRPFGVEEAIDIRSPLSGEAAARWSGGDVNVRAKLQLQGAGTEEHASDAKLSLSAGVYEGVATLSPTTRPTLAVSFKDAVLTTPDLSAEGIDGRVSFVDLDPPVTAPDQVLSAKKLKVGELEFTDGELAFQATPDGELLVRQTAWDFLGGRVLASNVSFDPAGGPIAFSLHARDVDLKRLLDAFAKGKASGEGKISGDLPVIIDGSKITFGDGNLTASAGGRVEIKDVAAIAPTAEAAAQAAKSASSSEQIKRNIIEALGDFQYERLSAELRNEDGALNARVRMSGRGRGGAKQPLDYELNLNGLDQLLRSYTGLQAALNGPAAPPATGKAGP
jgi:hypothetical protein